MAVKHWKQHGRDLWVECEQAWNWLRALPEYRADYQAAKKRPSPLFLNPPGSTILTGPTQPKDAFAEGLKNKWGFWPLIDPSKKMSSEFFKNMADLFDLHNEGGVTHKAFSYENLIKSNGEFRDHKNLPPLPKVISFSIKTNASTEPALDYIGEFLENVHRLYRIKIGRPRTTWLFKKYQAAILKKSGWTEKKIRTYITPKEWDVRSADDRRQCITRIMKESKKVFK